MFVYSYVKDSISLHKKLTYARLGRRQAPAPRDTQAHTWRLLLRDTNVRRNSSSRFTTDQRTSQLDAGPYAGHRTAPETNKNVQLHKSVYIKLF